MNKRQFRRWRSFAIKMAKHAYPNATPARQAKILEAVEWLMWIFEEDQPGIVSWDHSTDGYEYVGDKISTLMYERGWERHELRDGSLETRFSNQVSCCIRAGLDVAAEPSAGVVGFDVGMLRRMYPRGIPDWVNEGFNVPITDQIPDSEGVWL